MEFYPSLGDGSHTLVRARPTRTVPAGVADLSTLDTTALRCDRSGGGLTNQASRRLPARSADATSPPPDHHSVRQRRADRQPPAQRGAGAVDHPVDDRQQQISAQASDLAATPEPATPRADPRHDGASVAIGAAVV